MESHKHARDIIKYPNAMDDPYNKDKYTNFVRMMVIVMTLHALFCLIQRHRYKAKWKKDYFSEDKETKLYYLYKDVTSEEFDVYTPTDTSMFTY